MTTDELLPYLPASIAGYEAQEAETETMEMQAMSWTKVSRKYTSDNGNVQVDLVSTITPHRSGGWGLQRSWNEVPHAKIVAK